MIMNDGSFTLEVPPFLLRRPAASRSEEASDWATQPEAENLPAALNAAREMILAASKDLADTGRLPSHLHSPEGWFALLSRYPARDAMTVLESCRNGLDQDTVRRLTRFGLLQAALVAVRMVPGLNMAPAVKLLFCGVCQGIAEPKPSWGAFFEIGHARFEEIARVVTLRRFPAGQHDWNISRIPLSWVPHFRIGDLPRLVREMAALGGRPPMAVTHLNYMRPNPWVVLNSEAQKSYHRIARSIALHPEVQGLLTYSWFYCSSVAQATPHLAWLRQFLVDNGATTFEMQPAPESSGFTIGSRRRQELYSAGLFRPRITMVIWRRRELLTWARAHPELAAQDTRLQPHGLTARGRNNDGTEGCRRRE